MFVGEREGVGLRLSCLQTMPAIVFVELSHVAWICYASVRMHKRRLMVVCTCFCLCVCLLPG